MKFSTASALLALASAAFASPVEPVEKRAECHIFGFTYPCAASAAATKAAATTAAATEPAAAPTTTTAKAASTATGTSTGGKSAYTSGATADDIDDNTGCTELTVIFARGTSESGNIGSVVGPPMYQALLNNLSASKLTLQGVDYPANEAGNSDCGAAGGPDMAGLANNITARCPNTKIALSGYSQGACVVHNAVQQQGLSVSNIAAVVLFGDPFNGQSVGSVPASKLKEFCANGDDVCNGSGTFAITSAHLTYGSNATTAANFIISASGA